LRKITVHDLFNGVCDRNGDIKEEFRVEDPGVAERKAHLALKESRAKRKRRFKKHRKQKLGLISNSKGRGEAAKV